MTKLDGIYCARCGAEFDIEIKRMTSYSGPLHIPNLYCPFCGSRRLMKKKGIFFWHSGRQSGNTP